MAADVEVKEIETGPVDEMSYGLLAQTRHALVRWRLPVGSEHLDTASVAGLGMCEQEPQFSTIENRAKGPILRLEIAIIWELSHCEGEQPCARSRISCTHFADASAGLEPR